MLELLALVRGTEVMKDGLPVSLGAAMGTVYGARQQLIPTYVVPPPRDLISLLVDDLTGDHGDSAE